VHSITKKLNLGAFQRGPLWDDVGFVADHLLNAIPKWRRDPQPEPRLSDRQLFLIDNLTTLSGQCNPISEMFVQALRRSDEMRGRRVMPSSF
jgi:hypothetical protein